VPVSVVSSLSQTNANHQSYLSTKLAQAEVLEKEREAYQASLHAQNPEAARAYFEWSQAQQQQAQEEQRQTQRELKEQVMALQQQLEQTQQLLQGKTTDKNNNTKAAPPKGPTNVAPLMPTHSSGRPASLAQSAASVSSSQQDLPNTVVATAGTAGTTYFNTNQQLIQPSLDSVSLFFFTQPYCSGNFVWYTPPAASNTWSVGSWMSQDSVTGVAGSLLLCNNLPGAQYQRIFQATIYRAPMFESDTSEYLFYAYPGQCVCSATVIAPTPDISTIDVGSWKLVQI